MLAAFKLQGYSRPPKVASDPLKKLIYNEALFVSGTKDTRR